ncbi:MAG TPA: DMT family transporter [Gammaproteobacteria bacterium]|nr:DMT family transporter [Gammaproteobacteria bacterium]
MNPRLSVWFMLAALTVMWGSAFMFTKIAVAALPPQQVVAGRLLVAAAVLVLWVTLTGRRWPRSKAVWGALLLIAAIGTVVPFYLISWGQQHIDSAVAGMLMAVMPLVVMVLAHFFVPGEPLHRYRLAGFVLGFAGIVVLTGPPAFSSDGDGWAFVAMLAVLAGAVCYGVSTILSRLRPRCAALESAAISVGLAALFMAPVGGVGFVAGMAAHPPGALAAVVVLGVFGTALPQVIYFRLIAAAGPNFVSYLNYLIPPWAVLMGVVFLGEALAWRDGAALALILAGVGLSRRPPFPDRGPPA